MFKLKGFCVSLNVGIAHDLQVREFSSSFFLFLGGGFTDVSQIQFFCEHFDPCRPENDAKLCGQADPPCATELINASSQHKRDEGWYLCKAEIDLRLLHNNTSQSGGIVVLLLFYL